MGRLKFLLFFLPSRELNGAYTFVFPEIFVKKNDLIIEGRFRNGNFFPD